jgi:hypothetical protein
MRALLASGAGRAHVAELLQADQLHVYTFRRLET